MVVWLFVWIMIMFQHIELLSELHSTLGEQLFIAMLWNNQPMAIWKTQPPWLKNKSTRNLVLSDHQSSVTISHASIQ